MVATLPAFNGRASLSASLPENSRRRVYQRPDMNTRAVGTSAPTTLKAVLV
jgi:hypothetical protein